LVISNETRQQDPLQGLAEGVGPIAGTADEASVGLSESAPAPALIHSANVNASERGQPSSVSSMQASLRQLVLDAVPSTHTRRAYAKGLDDLFVFSAGRPLTRPLLQAWRATLDGLAPATVNVRLSAVRKLVYEARRNGMISPDEATNLADVPNLKQRGNRLGHWLTREQTKELLAVPDRSTIKGKRDYALLALLVGCGLRRAEVAALEPEGLQLRENRWVLADLIGKGGRIRTVAVPLWVKQAINAWQTAGNVEDGKIFRRLGRGGLVKKQGLGAGSICAIVNHAAQAIGIERFGAHDLRRTCAKLCRKAGGDLEQIKFLLGHSSIQTTERYLGSEQEIAVAVNDHLGL
jgi:integrase